MSDQTGSEPPRKPYWTRGAKTRWHTYFYAANDLSGVLLFGLIAVLGAVAVVVAARHIFMSGMLVRRDGTLLAIGGISLLLGGVQGCRLWRDGLW